MSFDSMLVHTATVSRLIKGTGVQSRYQVVEDSIPCTIQPITAEYASMTGFVYGRTYNGYFKEGADIMIGDRVIDQRGTEYRVSGTLDRNYGDTPHVTVTLTQQSKD